MSALSEQRRDELIDKLAQAVLRHGMQTPAVWFLEMHKPLGFIGAQALLFLEPVLGAFSGDAAIHEVAALLEERENVERLLARLERGQEPPSAKP
ncbi:MAG: hypothetical protein GXY76_16925 [Chloroflexi bacterium]|nr:hypothetical protein [Chloroflexota bacterium]